MNRITLVCMVVATLGVVGCATQTPEAIFAGTSSRSDVAPTVSLKATGLTDLRMQADQIELLQGGAELLSGHVAIQLPRRDLHVTTGQVTAGKDGSTEWVGNVRMSLGKWELVSSEAVVATADDTATISMKRARLEFATAKGL